MSFIQRRFEVFECIYFHVRCALACSGPLKTLVNLASFCQNSFMVRIYSYDYRCKASLAPYLSAARIFCCGLRGGVPTGGVEFANSKLASRQRASFIAVHSAQLFNFLA
jgi:hypothetical protein